MKILKKEHQFIKFLVFALLAIAVNLCTSHLFGYDRMYTNVIYAVATFLVIVFIFLFKFGYEFPAKLISAIFFNVFFFTFSYIYGLRSMSFIYYFPFLISYIYMYKDSATKREAKIFTATCLASLITIFFVCSMDGTASLTATQAAIMYKKNFLVAFALSAYYFNEIFGYLMLQMRLAQEASASKARFLSVMSHELRTPLNGIISAINLIDTTNNEAEKQKYSTVLKTSSEHLLNLVSNVLDYSKASSGKMELNPVRCSIADLLLNLKTVFEYRFIEKKLGLEILIDQDVKKFVLLDDIRFEQVLSNLLSNALKFTEKGKVTITASCVGVINSVMEVEISVKDTGQGLTKEQQKMIFDSFNNIQNKSRRVESSGLGLSICKMIVAMMEGTLLLESEVGKGSRFYFNICVPLAKMPESKTEVVSAEHQSLEGYKILIAEDNAINMMVAREFLRRWKVNILEATNGMIAQKMLIENGDIDLLLLDLQMPEMDGYELLEWIRMSGLALPVVAFSAQSMSQDEKKELLKQGFIDIIPKPFAPAELQEKLQLALVNKNRLVHV